MLEFSYLVLFRWLSGLQNALGYAGRQRGRMIVSFAMAIMLIGGMTLCFLMRPYWPANAIIGMLATTSIIGTAGVEDAFNTDIRIFPRDIHLFELLATGGITLAWAVAGGNLITIAAATYPGLIVHKGLINLGAGLPFWHHGTDDATGRTFSIPLLGLSVPRLPQSGRILLAIASVVATVVAASWGKAVTIYSLARLAGINL